MTLVYLLTMLTVLYSSIVVASHTKFDKKGIELDLKHKSMLLILPFFLFYLHFRAAKKVFKTDKTRAIKILMLSIVKYPVMLGAFIELLKESMAECNVFGSSQLVSFQKTKRVKNPTSAPAKWDVKNFLENFKNQRVYENMLIDRLAI